MPLYFLLCRVDSSSARARAEVRGLPPAALGRLGGATEEPAAVGRRRVPVPGVDHAAQDGQGLLGGARCSMAFEFNSASNDSKGNTSEGTSQMAGSIRGARKRTFSTGRPKTDLWLILCKIA